MRIEKNDTFTCEITGYGADGMGLCRINEIVCFVKGSVRGDVCLIRIVKTLRNCMYGIIEQLITPSPQRIESLCPHFPQCGGCDFHHMGYEEELWFKKTKVEEALSRIGGYTTAVDIVPSPQIARYRNKAQFPVAMVGDRVETGFFKARSHELVPMSDCLLQTDEANLLAKTVTKWATDYFIPIYDEGTKKGALRHIYVRTGTSSLQLCIVSAKKKMKFLPELVERCRLACPSLTSVVYNHNGLDTNSILGDQTLPVWGDVVMQGTLCDNMFQVSPKAFFQINSVQAENLYAKALEYAGLTGSETLLDLYCGIGTITLYMAGFAKEVWGIELVAEAVDNARENAQNNGITNARFICNDAANGAKAIISKGVKPDVIVVDPPRKGLDAETIDAILSLQPKKLVYVSCDPGTLARDIKLLSQNAYTPTQAQAYDMFPRTSHVECVVLLTRN